MVSNKKIKFLTINSFVVFIIMIFASCQKVDQNSTLKSQEGLVEVEENLLKLNPGKGLVFLKDEPFSGTSVGYFPDGKNKVFIDFKQGKKHGFYRKWFESGQLSFESQYTDGKKDGFTKTWWKNGKLRSEGNIENGISNGPQKQWYKSGAKFKVMTLVNGKELGLQQSWRENGKVYNNYEAKDGRIFGLKRASLCYELDDEIIQYKTD